MIIKTHRFGSVEVPDDRILMFPCGIMPFADSHWFALIERPSQAPFAWLQSVDEPALAFLVTDPHIFFPDYAPGYSRADVEQLDVAAEDEIVTLVILTIDADIYDITANLLGPIAIDFRTQRAVQVILRDDRFTTEHSIRLRSNACAVGVS